MKTAEFSLILKELQLVYGPRIKIEDQGHMLTITIFRELQRGQFSMYRPKKFHVRFGNSKMDGVLRQDMIGAITTGPGDQTPIHPNGFRNYLRKLLDTPITT